MNKKLDNYKLTIFSCYVFIAKGLNTVKGNLLKDAQIIS